MTTNKNRLSKEIVNSPEERLQKASPKKEILHEQRDCIQTINNSPERKNQTRINFKSNSSDRIVIQSLTSRRKGLENMNIGQIDGWDSHLSHNSFRKTRKRSWKISHDEGNKSSKGEINSPIKIKKNYIKENKEKQLVRSSSNKISPLKSSTRPLTSSFAHPGEASLNMGPNLVRFNSSRPRQDSINKRQSFLSMSQISKIEAKITSKSREIRSLESLILHLMKTNKKAP